MDMVTGREISFCDEIFSFFLQLQEQKSIVQFYHINQWNVWHLESIFYCDYEPVTD